MSNRAINWVKTLSEDGLTTHVKFVLFVLADYARDESLLAWPSQGRLAADTLMTDRSVRRALKELESLGYITRFRQYRAGGGRTSDEIHLNVPDDFPDERRSKRQSIPDTDDKHTGLSTQTIPDRESGETSRENPQEKPQEDTPSYKVPPADTLACSHDSKEEESDTFDVINNAIVEGATAPAPQRHPTPSREPTALRHPEESSEPAAVRQPIPPSEPTAARQPEESSEPTARRQPPKNSAPPPLSHPEIASDAKPDPFPAFWARWPVHIHKREAESEFKEALKITDLPTILAGVDRLVKHVQAERAADFPDRKYPSPARWLAGRRWEDEFEAPRGSGLTDAQRQEIFARYPDRRRAGAA